MRDDILAAIESDRHAKRRKVRQVIAESGHPESATILRDMDRALWDVEAGVAQARSTWAALSAPQKRVMLAMGEGRALARQWWSRTTYDAVGDPHAISAICRIPTVKNLKAHGLIESDNPSDALKRLVLSSWGKFVIKHGEKP